MVRPRFATLILDDKLARSNLSGVDLRASPRHDEVRACSPHEVGGFRSLFTSLGVPQAGVPFLPSVSVVAKAEMDYAFLPYGQTGIVADPGSKLVWRATIAHAIRASLFASAHATTFAWRRLTTARVHSAR